MTMMWLIGFLYFLTAVTANRTQDVRIEKFHNVARKNKGIFEDKILKEFPSTGVLISPRKEVGALDDITTIKNGDMIILRNLRLIEEPEIKITSLNATLDFFSTRIGIDAGNVSFVGQIFINEGVEPEGDVRYTLTNVKASGIVGLGSGENGTFVSKHFLMNYFYRNINFELYWNDELFDEYDIDGSDLPEKQIKAGVRTAINAIFKKRFDAVLAKISVRKIFGFRRSKVASLERRWDSAYNGLVDSIITELNAEIENSDSVEIALPDLEIPFTYRLMGVSVSGRVLALEGWLRNLSTFVRKGPVTMTHDYGTVYLVGSLGLQNLTLGYDVCAVQIAGVGPYGSIYGTIGHNVAQLEIAITVSNQMIELTSFVITQIDDVNVKVSGLGPFNWLASRITNRVVNGLKNDVVPMVEPKISEQLREVISKIKVSDIIRNFMF